ncbi:zinc finger and BTB domain-containing protein 16-A isoform X2 [Corythoichthys intestinalis]|uniref:zinc finger and BTB domain-containing protein 16-A isoform X2 n=1 Tax=Corythoichthys intestinalis TaxID=161448 RepID=UPI0025A59726|nr:zinc finger and BTB domain-containing protein 16-A isoform X2 [Corythoichthys intestinalis]
MIRLENTQYFHFLHRANALRRSGSMCDVVISVKNHTFSAHRLVLACASRRLAKILTQAETNQEMQYTLEDLSPRTFEQVLDFAYMQSLEVSKNDLQQLLMAAQLLEMQPLKEQCQHYLDALHHMTGEAAQKHEGNSESDEERELQQKRHKEDKPQEIPIIKNNMKETATAEDPRKKSRLSTFSRGCVISNSVSNLYSSPWTMPSHRWASMGSLRHIAYNYSTLMRGHDPQPPAAHAIALVPPRIFPLQGPHFQSSAHRSVVADLYPHHTQQLHTATNGMVRNIKPGLQVTKTMTSRNAGEIIEICCSEVHKVETAKYCKHCSSGLHRNPTSSPSGEACAQCKTSVTDCTSSSNEQDLREARPYKCQHCSKRFNLKHQLNTHHRIHTAPPDSRRGFSLPVHLVLGVLQQSSSHAAAH